MMSALIVWDLDSDYNWIKQDANSVGHDRNRSELESLHFDNIKENSSRLCYVMEVKESLLFLLPL